MCAMPAWTVEIQVFEESASFFWVEGRGSFESVLPDGFTVGRLVIAEMFLSPTRSKSTQLASDGRMGILGNV